MNEFKVAAIIDESTIAVKISDEEMMRHNINAGDTARIVSKTITIKDPDNDSEDLGTYVIYKDSLEVTELRDNFIIAKKYTLDSRTLPVSFGGKKHLSSLNIDKDKYDIDYSKKIEVGDLVEFFE